jgi:hypothetical protein
VDVKKTKHTNASLQHVGRYMLALLAQLWSLLELLDSKLLCPQNAVVVICQLEFKALIGKRLDLVSELVVS